MDKLVGDMFQSPDEDSLTPEWGSGRPVGMSRYEFQSPDEDSLTPET